MYTIILFYKYTDIENPDVLMDSQRDLCKKLNLKGRMIIATEGINATLEGETKQIEKYMSEMKKDSRFVDIHWKKSNGTGEAFPKLSIKVRPEIVSGHLDSLDVNPRLTTGKYLTPEELHNWIHSEKREFYIIDMRNDYETHVGYFENSIFPGIKNFKDIKSILPQLEHLKNKTILTVCTGGVRCEKASGFLVANGFSDVYQLSGGIVSYMEKYPNMDFKGKLYVFDNRIVMGFHTDDPTHEIVGRCAKCNKPSEWYINCKDSFCNRHFIACHECLGEEEKILCPMGCRDYSKEHPELFTSKN